MNKLPPNDTPVLFQIDGFSIPVVGTYSHEKDEWSFIHFVCRTMSGSDQVIEWWPLPEPGTGNKV